MRDGKFTFFTETDGLSSNHIKAIYSPDNETLWIGTAGGGLNYMKNKQFQVFTEKEGLSSNYIESLCSDRRGNLWIGTPNGLNLMSGHQIKVYTEENGLANNSIKALLNDSQERLWIGTYGGGLNCLEKGVFSTLNRQNGLVDDYVLALEEDLHGNLWIGTNNGISCLGQGLFRYFAGAHVPQGMVLDIFSDSQDAIWFTSDVQGLIRYKNGTFLPLDTLGPLKGSKIYNILEDDNHDLWFTSNRGIFTAPLKDLNRCLDRGNVFINWRGYNEEDGLKTSVCSGGFQPAGWKTADGTIWCPTIKGIAALNQEKPTLTVKKPIGVKIPAKKETTGFSYVIVSRQQPLIIESVTVDGKVFDPTDYLELPAGVSRVQFHFAAINYVTRENMVYKYYLKGYDHSWTRSRSRKSIVYRDLPPGEYEFKVSAASDDGRWDIEAASCYFSVGTPFFQSFWFYFILTGLLVFLVFGIPEILQNRSKKEEDAREKYKSSTLTNQKSKRLLTKLISIMENEQPFLDPDISLQALAQRMDITKEDLSQVINEQLNKNFKNFINEYRIEAAKKKLMDPKENQFVLLKIAFDVGFNSKSAFNASFKKCTGLSPSDFKKQYQSDDGVGGA